VKRNQNSLPPDTIYAQISEDWRHRDNITWQIPSVVIAIGGSAIVAAFALDIDPDYARVVRLAILFIASSLSFCLTLALTQNLFYQIACGKALERLEKGIELPSLKDRSCRTLKPSDFRIEGRFNLLIEILRKLTGSLALLLVCHFITIVLIYLALKIAGFFHPLVTILIYPIISIISTEIVWRLH